MYIDKVKLMDTNHKLVNCSYLLLITDNVIDWIEISSYDTHLICERHFTGIKQFML
jgi:hypothetical protein